MRITRLAVSGLGAGLAAATLAVATCLPSEAATPAVAHLEPLSPNGGTAAAGGPPRSPAG